MPRLSDNTLFQRAVVLAIQDRNALADAYPKGSPHGLEAREEARRIQALKGKHIDALTDADQPDAFAAFVNAELWVSGLIGTNQGKAVEDDSRRQLRLFREVRLRRWGKTQLEVMMETARSVDVRTLAEKGASAPSARKDEG